MRTKSMSREAAGGLPAPSAPSAAISSNADIDVTGVEDLIPPSNKSRIWIVRLLSIVFVIGAWEVLGRQVDPLFMSYPSAILVAAKDLIASGELFIALVSSLRTLLVA